LCGSFAFSESLCVERLSDAIERLAIEKFSQVAKGEIQIAFFFE
jgi:hypothetical protein